ncbi:tyrosine-protein phosphatase [Cryobacterium sp. Hh38]|uniref:tyrosine-protein phosphatase n=1 Tax=Cryobacterium sp. Hh38 TaxID=1259156 RepID=UPI00106C6055|nr:tyrosine-protein phosphatase [Cryobacterium sp. Hh38]TFD56478.1 tyrosine-protein phosphatase [Cryobacterium sp. Hh38]
MSGIRVLDAAGAEPEARASRDQESTRAELVNLRDAGAASPLLRRGVLFRSDAPLTGDSNPDLTEPHAAAAWPPPTVIDLRDDAEKRERHPFTESRVIDLPLLQGAGHDPALLANGLGALYVGTLVGSQGRLLAQAVTEIAAAENSVLVHCTAGKDRTGVTIAVTLALLGVDREAIVADYALTSAAMPAVLARMLHTVDQATAGTALMTGGHQISVTGMPRDVLLAPPAAMLQFLETLDAYPARPISETQDAQIPGAEMWFFAHGGTERTLIALRTRLLV